MKIDLLTEEDVRRIVREELAGAGRGTEYSSVGQLPHGVSRRTFREHAARMLGEGIAGVRREGRGRRDCIYVVSCAAWHGWRTSARTTPKAAGPSDQEIVDASLRGAGLRLVGGRK